MYTSSYLTLHESAFPLDEEMPPPTNPHTMVIISPIGTLSLSLSLFVGARSLSLSHEFFRCNRRLSGPLLLRGLLPKSYRRLGFERSATIHSNSPMLASLVTIFFMVIQSFIEYYYIVIYYITML